MKILLCMLLSMFFYSGISQDTIYLNSEYDQIAKDSVYIYFKVVQAVKNDTIERLFHKSGKIMSEKTYSDYSKRLSNGLSQEWYEDGTIKSQINYKNGNFNGFLNTFWPNGKAKREDIYSNGEFTKGKCYDSTGMEIPHFEYIIPPEFPGGVNALLEYIGENTNYPEIALNDGITGKIFIRFVVTKTGEIGSTRVMRPVDPLLDDEALRVIKSMPRWTPGYTDGLPVNVYYIIPIDFKLQ